MDTSNLQPRTKKLSKAELIELASYMYSRYESKYRHKKDLHKKFGMLIMRMGKYRDTFKT